MKIIICVMVFVALTMAEEALEKLTNANNELTGKFFYEVVKENPGKSVITSVFSLLTPLAQLSLAAVGESRDQLLDAINLENDNEIKEVFPVLNNQLRNIKGVELKTASKIYVSIGNELNENYATVSRDVFESEVKNVDFQKNVQTAKEINEWVEDHTNNRIKDLVDPKSLGSDTRAVLVNAIYFKGSWKSKFDKSGTTDRDFHVTKDKTVKLPTMYKKDDYLYAESAELNAKLLEIPYEGDESSFLIVLPNEIDGVSALVEKLKDPSSLENAVKTLRSQEVAIYIPKFKIETTTDLKETLSNIGITKIFSPAEAKLDNLLKDSSDLYVDQAIQKAFIEVNEEGAEAAAANEFVIVEMSMTYPQIFDANKSFVFYLKANDKILFTGVFNA